MERRCYTYKQLYIDVLEEATIIAAGHEGEIYQFGDEVFKIFHNILNIKNQEYLEDISKLSEDYLTVPIAEVYVNIEYCGYTMKYAGRDLASTIADTDLSRSDIMDILKQLKTCVEYLHSISAAHGDIKLKNILLENGQIRLGDVNNLILKESTPHLNALHKEWYKKYPSFQLVDIFALNYLTFLLLNFPVSNLRRNIYRGIFFSTPRDLPCFINEKQGFVDDEVWDYVRELLQGNTPESKKRYLKPDIVLLDYL